MDLAQLAFDAPPCAPRPPATTDDVEAMRLQMEAQFAARLRAVEAKHARELEAAQRSGAPGDEYDAKPLPLLKATRALLEAPDESDGEDEDPFSDPFSDPGPDDAPRDVAALLRDARDVPSHRRYPHYAVDLVLVDRAAAARDWARARVAAKRVLRVAERYATDAAPPPGLAALAGDVRSRERAAALPSSDRAAFDVALNGGDFELARVLGEQILAAPRPPSPPRAEDDGWV